MEVQEGLKDVKHARHLGEDQHFRALDIESLQELRQALQLPAIVLNEILVREEEDVGEL